MTKFLRTVEITPSVGSAVTFADTATYQGGSIAWDQARYGKDVIVPNAAGTEITMIPFHAIVKVVTTVSTTTVEDAEDAFCTPTEEDGGGDGEGG